MFGCLFRSSHGTVCWSVGYVRLCDDFGGKFLEKWKRDALLRREIEKVVPSKSARSKQKIQDALRQFKGQTTVEIDQPEATIWRLTLTEMFALDTDLNLYVGLQNGEVLKFVAAIPKPPGFTKGQFVVFANEWNKGKNFARAYIKEEEEVRLHLEYDLNVEWISDSQFDEVFSKVLSVFSAIALAMTMEVLKVSLSDDSELRTLLQECNLRKR